MIDLLSCFGNEMKDPKPPISQGRGLITFSERSRVPGGHVHPEYASMYHTHPEYEQALQKLVKALRNYKPEKEGKKLSEYTPLTKEDYKAGKMGEMKGGVYNPEEIENLSEYEVLAEKLNSIPPYVAITEEGEKFPPYKALIEELQSVPPYVAIVEKPKRASPKRRRTKDAEITVSPEKALGIEDIEYQLFDGRDLSCGYPMGAPVVIPHYWKGKRRPRNKRKQKADVSKKGELPQYLGIEAIPSLFENMIPFKQYPSNGLGYEWPEAIDSHKYIKENIKDWRFLAPIMSLDPLMVYADIDRFVDSKAVPKVPKYMETKLDLDDMLTVFA